MATNVRYEVGIVWLDESAKARPFLRECVDAHAVGRTRPITGKKYGRAVVAYSVLSTDAERVSSMRGRFARRYWYNNDTDPEEGGGYCVNGWCNDACVEGVLPESIAPNQPSTPAWDVLRAMPRRWV